MLTPSSVKFLASKSFSRNFFRVKLKFSCYYSLTFELGFLADFEDLEKVSAGFGLTNFQDFSRTFPGLSLIFQGL